MPKNLSPGVARALSEVGRRRAGFGLLSGITRERESEAKALKETQRKTGFLRDLIRGGSLIASFIPGVGTLGAAGLAYAGERFLVEPKLRKGLPGPGKYDYVEDVERKKDIMRMQQSQALATAGQSLLSSFLLKGELPGIFEELGISDWLGKFRGDQTTSGGSFIRGVPSRRTDWP